ncbi:helix-turn-helix domain-containing protein [Crateriforma conspicua]|uniref:Helix-turn-helix domain protein n=1 Tax=Crateriforma conspicua TaxID=2527996 RepID=A0A5C6FU41_9PLAN|nr:helix-turn-helix domain-containing protein [Crateriforma conspicua]TWU64990.1 hypothetical protein V7x_05340 [Crateriforma conspicua]
MANYLSLEEAAAKLGIPAERLVELRSQGQVRGFRDGASWKFPDTEIDRLADDLADSGMGSGILYDEGGSGSSLGSKHGSVIGGDQAGEEGSDVNLTVSPQESEDSDVALVAGGSDVQAKSPADTGTGSGPELLDVDDSDLQLDGPAVDHDSAELELAAADTPETSGKKSGESSLLDLDLEEDSAEAIIASEDSDLDILDDDKPASSGTSSLELMSDLEDASQKAASDSGADVLSELDLLSAEQAGSGLISGLGSGLVTGSDVGSGSGKPSDDALADDDDLVIADDDDDLVIDSAGSDISVAGDSGINLMSPSDSGLSLESEPLDLAGSSISALDLGAEIGSGSGSGASDDAGSAVDFQADEEFQLSPSGIGLETDEDSGSQVIEVEESEVADAVDFGDGGFGGDDAFAEDAGVVEEPVALGDADAMSLDTDDVVAPAAGTVSAAPEIPFTMWQVACLAGLACTLALCGMIATDLVRNMWAYAEPASPVSGLTDALIGLLRMNP